MKRAEIVLWIMTAVMAVAVTVICLQNVPSTASSADDYNAAALSLDEDGAIVFQIDLNTADRLQLMRLPGMTAEIAQAAIDYRDHYGRFLEAQEIGNVAGVTIEMRDRWIPYLTVGTETDAESSS